MIKRFESFDHENSIDEYKFLKEEMDLDEDEDEEFDEDEDEDESDDEDEDDEEFDEDESDDDDDDDFDDYEDGGTRDLLSIRAQKLFVEYNMNEKTIRYLLNKCKEFSCIKDTDLAYLFYGDRGGRYGNGWYISWGDKSKKVKFNDRYIPVVMLELRIDVVLGSKTMDVINYDMIIWTEDDNYISYIDPIRCDYDNRLGRPIALGVCETHREPQYPTKVTMEDFFKMLQTGPFVK
jgi:hypothetical protein